jgi:hypothetical protein
MKNPINYGSVLCLGSLILLERSVGLEIEKAYSEMRAILLEKGCRIVSEEPPQQISIEHGSLFGVSPKSAKKVVSYQLFPRESGTRIVGCSSVSSGWSNLTFWGNVIAGVVAIVFWWIASDIASLIVGGASGYWTWLAVAFGYPHIQYTLFMINLTRALSIVLVVIILLEILDVFVVWRKIDTFAAETLDELKRKQSVNLAGLN